MNKEKDDYVVTGNIRIISKETGKENFYKYKITKKEEKNLYNKIKELIIENKFEVILIIFSVFYYLINLIYNILKKNQFNLPFEYFKINFIEGLFYVGFLAGGPLIFIFLEKFIKVDEFNKKILKIESVAISFVFVTTLSLKFGNIMMLIIFFIFPIILIFILFKKNIPEKIKNFIYLFYFFIYIITITYYLIMIIGNSYEILKIGGKDKVVITIYEGKYLIMNCDIKNKELKIYKDNYNFIEINSEKIEKIQYIKFDKVE